MEQADAALRCRARQESGGVAIDPPRDLRLALGAVDRRIGGGVDEEVGAFAVERRRHGGCVRDVERAPVWRRQIDAGRRAIGKGAGKLAAAAGDERLHAYPGVSASVLPAASLADSTGVPMPSSGQSMPRAGSFHSRLCSSAGS